MQVDPTTLVFFDASCLVAAAGRPVGGAGYVLSLCARDLLRAVVSHPVLVEAERNIRAHFPDATLTTYHEWLARSGAMVVAVPALTARSSYRELVGEKDEHVFAAAVAAGAPFLLSLDRPLVRGVNEANLPIRALSPGEFINDVLPKHVDAQSLRE